MTRTSTGSRAAWRAPVIGLGPLALAALATGDGGVFKAHGQGKSGNATPFGPLSALSCDGAVIGRRDMRVGAPGALHPRPGNPNQDQGATKLWDLLRPGGMRVPRHGRHRIPIAL